jgi:hypothetical protein
LQRAPGAIIFEVRDHRRRQRSDNSIERRPESTEES